MFESDEYRPISTYQRLRSEARLARRWAWFWLGVCIVQTGLLFAQW